MTDDEFPHEWADATRIINNAFAEAIDDAIEADISAGCFMAAVLYHACTTLVEHFEHTADDVGLLAQQAASIYVARGAAMTVKH